MPASKNAAISRFKKSTPVIETGAQECLLLCCGNRRNGVARGSVFRENNVHLAAGLVLHDHERSPDLTIRTKLKFAAGQQRIFQIYFAQSIADGSLVETAGLLDTRRQCAYRVIGGGRVPGVRIVSGELLVVGVELLYLRIRQVL